MTGRLIPMPKVMRADPAESVLPPPPARLDGVALFTDLDGALAPLEATPQAVGPDGARRLLLDDLAGALSGRLAVISGRTLEDLDRILEGRVVAIGAVHGLVRRAGDGEIHRSPPAAGVAQASLALNGFAQARSGLLVEDKGAAVALHYRANPALAAACREIGADLAARFGLEVQAGDCVVELRSPGPDKGGALRDFMAEPPFSGATPVFMGDDLTDEAGFRAARELGGYGVVVGARRPTQARFAVADVAAAHAWLRRAVTLAR
jgi:trehalose 6-phosphate phosphatase